MAYLTHAEFKARTLMKPADVDALEVKRPGHVALLLEDETAWIDARLRKRYAAPFAAPVQPVVRRWLTQLVTLKALLAWGFHPESPQDALIEKQHDLATAEIKEAADAETGLFDLPLRADTTATGISKGGPLAYSEASPYTWMDRQREAVADEQ
jgi:hypothetical protein